MADSIYAQMLAAGVRIDNHETDLYALVTPESRAIVDQYEFKANVRTFINQIDGRVWFDIPFAYLPAWDKKIARHTMVREAMRH